MAAGLSVVGGSSVSVKGRFSRALCCRRPPAPRVVARLGILGVEKEKEAKGINVRGLFSLWHAVERTERQGCDCRMADRNPPFWRACSCKKSNRPKRQSLDLTPLKSRQEMLKAGTVASSAVEIWPWHQLQVTPVVSREASKITCGRSEGGWYREGNGSRILT